MLSLNCLVLHVIEDRNLQRAIYEKKITLIMNEESKLNIHISSYKLLKVVCVAYQVVL